MSVYEDYESASLVYDNSRRAVGTEFYLGSLIQHVKGKSLDQMRMLDIGSGTGNYCISLLECGVGHVSMFDGSEGMLEKARLKCEPFITAGRCDATYGILPVLPYETNSFDAAMCNQVIHHLGANNSDYGVLKKTLAEMYKVVKPNGILFINFTTLEQLYSFWYMNLLPSSVERYEHRLPTIKQLQAFLAEAGFAVDCVEVPLYSTLQSWEVYSKYDGVYDDKVRKMDSGWALASNEDVQKALQTITELKSSGKLAAQAEKWESYRLQHGQCTTVRARKV